MSRNVTDEIMDSGLDENHVMGLSNQIRTLTITHLSEESIKLKTWKDEKLLEWQYAFQLIAEEIEELLYERQTKAALKLQKQRHKPSKNIKGYGNALIWLILMILPFMGKSQLSFTMGNGAILNTQKFDKIPKKAQYLISAGLAYNWSNTTFTADMKFNTSRDVNSGVFMNAYMSYIYNNLIEPGIGVSFKYYSADEGYTQLNGFAIYSGIKIHILYWDWGNAYIEASSYDFRNPVLLAGIKIPIKN